VIFKPERTVLMPRTQPCLISHNDVNAEYDCESNYDSENLGINFLISDMAVTPERKLRQRLTIKKPMPSLLNLALSLRRLEFLISGNSL
jgi:hypothetical protein